LKNQIIVKGNIDQIYWLVI